MTTTVIESRETNVIVFRSSRKRQNTGEEEIGHITCAP